MRRRRKVSPSARASRPRCVLDSGALSALSGDSLHARRWLRWIVEHDGLLIVPTPVLVESTTGDPGRDAETNRILKVLARSASTLVSPDEAIARDAGRRRFRAKTDDGIDALVAATAASSAGACVLLTSDPDDLKRLLASDPQVSVVRV